MSDDPTVGEQIRAARMARKWTLEQLATAAGVSRSSLSRMERGDQDVTVEDGDRLARALGITIVLGDGEEISGVHDTAVSDPDAKDTAAANG